MISSRTAYGDRDAEREIRAEQVRLLYADNPAAIAVSGVVAAVLVWLLQGQTDATLLWGWFLVLLVICGVRLGLVAWYRRCRPASDDHGKWFYLFVLGTVAAGVVWGVAAPLLIPPVGSEHAAVIVICLIGVAAGAVNSLSWHYPVALAFLVPTLLPTVVHFSMTRTPVGEALAMLVALFLLGMGVMSHRMARHATENLRLRLETDRQRDELAAQEAHYRGLVESTSAVFWEQDPETFGFTFISSTVESVLGYPVRNWLWSRRFWLEHLHPDDRNWVPDQFEAALLDQHEKTYEYRMIAADGSTVWLRDMASVTIRDGRTVKHVGVMLDITERKRMESELAYVSGLQATLVEISPWLIAADFDASDSAIEKALGEIGRYCDVAHSYLFRYRDQGRVMDNTHEWRAADIPPHIDSLQAMACSELPALTDAMQRGKPVVIAQVAALDDSWAAERALLNKLGIRSAVLVPVAIGTRIDGFLGFDAVAKERRWEREEIRLLRVLADLLGATLERVEVSAALSASEARYRDVLESINEVIFRTDLEGRFTFLNSAWETITGFDLDASLGRRQVDFVHSEDQTECLNEQACLVAGQRDTSQLEIRYLTHDGSVRWLGIEARAMRDDVGRVLGTTGLMRDVTVQREAERHMRYLAHHDALTGLPNRSLALDRLDQMIKGVQRSGVSIAALFVDLDGFKKINDSIGHQAGDEVLVLASKRLAEHVRDGDTVARLSGDEFLVLLRDVREPEAVGVVADKLLERFRAPFHLGDRGLFVSASIGIAIAPANGETPEELLRNADTAMYHAKDAGRDTYCLFTESMNSNIARRLTIERELRAAIAHESIEVAFQPIVHLTSGETVGAEALARWYSNELGEVDSAEFVPLAEQADLIGPLGNLVLERALDQVAMWRAHLRSDFWVSVNVSPQQFTGPDLVATIAAHLHSRNLPGDALAIEITEGVLLGRHRYVAAALAGLRDLGVRIAMDDFGTGYASLSYLRDYPFDTLKIDSSFIRGIDSKNDHRALVDSSLRLAHAFPLRAIAEGVETEAELAVVRELGCEFAQGYLFGYPTDAATFELALSAHDGPPAIP